MTADNLIDAIRAALDPAAIPDTRAAGAAACHMVLAALDATPGQPMATGVPSSPAPQIAGIVGALRGVPPDQLLDLAIAKLRAALPAGTEVPQAQPLKFHLVPVAAPAGRTR